MIRRTHVSIQAEKFFINGAPTYADRIWNGMMIEGLLFGARPSSGALAEGPALLEALQHWRRHGLLALMLSMQEAGASVFSPDGALLPPVLSRLEQVLDEADWLRMVVILSVLGPSPDQMVRGGIRRALEGALDWLTIRRFRNVLVVIGEEGAQHHAHVWAEQVQELLLLARNHPGRFLVGTSYSAGLAPSQSVLAQSHFLLVNGSSLTSPDQVTRTVAELRGMSGYRPMPVLLHAGEPPVSHMLAAVAEYGGWGYAGLEPSAVDTRHEFLSLLRDVTGV